MESRVISGRYRLQEQLGRGGMGVVWRARDERLGRAVAVKVLHPWVADDPDLRARFEREAAALARLEHPNLVRLYDVLEDGGTTVLVMEVIDGDSLAAIAAGRSLAWADVRRLCGPVAAALAHAHARGVVHRDLTPANVMVERRTGRVVVTDFGLARLARSTGSLPTSGILAGTPEYWAPEQAAGGETGSPTDLYALGCIVFRLLSGRVPFSGEDRLAAGLRRAHEPAPPLAGAAPSAPAEACVLVDGLLAREPSRRPDATGAALALGADPASLPLGDDTTARAAHHDRAAPVLDAETRVLREPATIAARPARSYRAVSRRRVAVAMAGLGSLLALAGGGVYAIARHEPPGVDAPDVVGDPVAAARSQIGSLARAAEIAAPRVRIVLRSYSESVPAESVIAQEPEHGARMEAADVLRLSVSKGSAYAEIPSVAGLTTADAVSLLRRSGFAASRRYRPSLEIAPWHAVGTSPEPGTRTKRPARVDVVVSTGPPQVSVPAVDGLDADGAAEALGEAGLEATLTQRPSTEAEPGAVLRLEPASGARIPVGSTVTVVVARAPVWQALSEIDGRGDGSTRTVDVPAGARVVLRTDDKSLRHMFGEALTVSWTGDESGATQTSAGSELVLIDRAERERTIDVTVQADHRARWSLVVEGLR